MSVQKFLAEADKLLEKGKIPDAIEKLKSAIASDPGNQLVVTKLANLYLSASRLVEAAQIYVRLAEHISSSGKSQVAIAVFKKALEILPNDIGLRAKYAFECEQGGKLGDAHASGQEVLRYYLARKKYFEALNIFPLLFRVQPREVSLRSSWLDTLIKGQADQKIIHFLVALCGPPGIVSTEIPTGGDPTEISAALYEQLKTIVSWYPRDPKVAYALAWVAYRQQKMEDFFKYLHEAIRRDPDYTLSYMLFARYLSESKKLNECLFIYKLTKDRLQVDRSTDQLLLNRQLEAFVEKNGWIEFSDGSSDEDELSAQAFLEAFTGKKETSTEEKSVAAQKEENEAADKTSALNKSKNADGSPMEIELSSGVPDDSMVLELSRNGPVLLKEEEISVLLTSLIQGPPPKHGETAARPIEESKPSAKPGFNPFDQSVFVPGTNPHIPGITEDAERTIQFSPMEILAASSTRKAYEFEPAPPKVQEEDVPPVFVESERTVMFSPMEALPVVSFESEVEAEEKTIVQPALPKTISAPESTAEPEIELNQSFQSIQLASTIEIEPEQATMVAPEQMGALSGLDPLLENLPQTFADLDIPDLGDDLLEGKTRVLVVDTQKESTQNLLSEVAREMQNKEADPRVEMDLLLRKAERFLAKRNYYLARKALRHAQILGADPEMIKERLREVRKAELPDSMYAMVSNDSPESKNNEALLQHLEADFHTADDKDSNSELLIQQLDPNFSSTLDRLLGENDSQTLFDLGVGLYEMGLFAGAEKIFTSLVQKEPENSFNAYYLSAMTRSARKDYAGAVSILKKLTNDKTKSEQEKLPIYYSLGEVLEKMHQLDRSRAVFEKVAKIDANFRNVREKING